MVAPSLCFIVRASSIDQHSAPESFGIVTGKTGHTMRTIRTSGLRISSLCLSKDLKSRAVFFTPSGHGKFDPSVKLTMEILSSV